MLLPPDPDQLAATVLAIYASFARKDLDGVFGRLDPDVEIRQSPQVPWGGVHRGHDQAMRYFGLRTAHIEVADTIDRLIVTCDAVVRVGRSVGHVVATGARLEIDEVDVWRLRNGKVTRLEVFADTAALRAALERDPARGGPVHEPGRG